MRSRAAPGSCAREKPASARMQDAGEDVNPIAAFTPPPQDARTTNTTNTRQNDDAVTRQAVPPYRRVTSPEAQKELEATAQASEKEGKHYRFGDVEEGFLPLKQLISVKRGKTYVFQPDYYTIDAWTGGLGGRTGNWGSSSGEKVSCMCKEEGSQGRFESKQFKISHLVLAAVRPDIPVDTADHIDGNYYNNSIFNLDNVSREENTRRKNYSKTGKEASTKSADTRRHRYRMLDAAGRLMGVFTEKEARTYLRKTIKLTHISQAARSGGRGYAYGYYWESVNPGPTREALVGGPPRIIVYFDDLRNDYKEQIGRKLQGRQKPPKAFSNYGEVMDKNGRWTVGNEEKRKCGEKTREYFGKLMHHWMILAFHEDRDEVERWIKRELEILHKDGDENNPEKYHRLTHEECDDSKPYTNYYFTLRLDTRAENRGDRRAKEARTPKKPRLNND